MVVVPVPPALTVTGLTDAVRLVLLLVTVTLRVTVFFGEELSDTTSEVLPAATPLTVTTLELIEAVAIELVGCVVIEYGAVPPDIVVVPELPALTVNGLTDAVRLVLLLVTVTEMVIVFSGTDASFTTRLVVPALIPVIVTVDPEMAAVATEAFGAVLIEYGVTPPLMTDVVFVPVCRLTEVLDAVNPVAVVTGSPILFRS